LEKQPTHFDALHLSGVIAAQNKDYAMAAHLISNAIAIDSTSPLAHYNLGIAFQKLKVWEEALACYDRAIKIDRNYCQAHLNRGNTLKELNRMNEALVCYDKAIAIDPNYYLAYSNKGDALNELKRHEEALAYYDKAISIKPDYAEAYSNRGNTLQELKRFEEALAYYDKAVAIKPGYAEAYSNRGTALQELRRLEEALACYEKAIAIDPNYHLAYSNKGNALKESKRLEEALTYYDKAIAIKPDYAEAYSNRGTALQELRRLEDAIAYYDKAIAIKLDYAEAYFNKSLALLLSGDLTQGWELYEWRSKYEKTHLIHRNFTQPIWLGTDNMLGKTILLHPDQGLGDTIQFSRYAKLVKSLGARVIMETPKELLAFLSVLDGVDELIEEGKELPAFDYHCPLSSLPLAFKTELNNIPNSKAYLYVLPQKREEWAQRLGTKGKPRVGLVWSGNTEHKNDHNRSMMLKQLLPYLPDGYDYVSLQKEVREVDKEVLESSGIEHYEDELKDFTDTAALCESMDLVISVDTSVAHMAAAMGKTTWVLLPFAPDWRWLLDREDSPWYESIKLYRQDESREWLPVLKRVRQDLSSKIQHPHRLDHG
jgi:tetratricopeptide (TPR) repeat protein